MNILTRCFIDVGIRPGWDHEHEPWRIRQFRFLPFEALGFQTNQTNRVLGRNDVWLVFNLETEHGDDSTPALSYLHLEPSICCLLSRWWRDQERGRARCEQGAAPKQPPYRVL